jgi:hypothetical protein
MESKKKLGVKRVKKNLFPMTSQDNVARNNIVGKKRTHEQVKKVILTIILKL